MRGSKPFGFPAFIPAPTASEDEAKLGWKATVETAGFAPDMVGADIAALPHGGRPWINKVKLASCDQARPRLVTPLAL